MSTAPVEIIARAVLVRERRILAGRLRSMFGGLTSLALPRRPSQDRARQSTIDTLQ